MRPSLYSMAGWLAGCSLLVGCSHNQRPATYTYSRPVVATSALPPAALAAVPAQPVESKPVVTQEVEKPAVLPVLPVKYKVGEDEAAKRRSFADITAKPCYDHDPDYRWLQGELQFVHARNAWRLRYASVDEEDRYGGSVTLSEVGSMSSYSNGQFVRVEGCMENPESKEPSPAYRVTSINALPEP